MLQCSHRTEVPEVPVNMYVHCRHLEIVVGKIQMLNHNQILNSATSNMYTQDIPAEYELISGAAVNGRHLITKSANFFQLETKQGANRVPAPEPGAIALLLSNLIIGTLYVRRLPVNRNDCQQTAAAAAAYH